MNATSTLADHVPFLPLWKSHSAQRVLSAGGPHNVFGEKPVLVDATPIRLIPPLPVGGG